MTKESILVGVGGGIAAYKSAALCSLLVKRGYDVQVVMTEHATRFIQPLTFQSLTRNPVVIDTFEEPRADEIAHIAMADRASAYLIAPATANLIGKLAHGIADDMVTTTALAVTSPVIIAPAMNVHMYDHRAVQENLSILKNRGVTVVDPGSGPLACGYTGKGRLPEPEDLVEVLTSVLSADKRRDFTGLHVLVSAGPTIEDIDPVRFLSNPSTGKMGFAIAEVAVRRGARVTLISGPTHLPSVAGANVIPVRSTDDMLSAVSSQIDSADVFISAAAPADFRPEKRFGEKWKKENGIPELHLERTPDILAAMRERKRPGQTFVGFAAETSDVVRRGREKLAHKQLDLLVANNVSEVDAGFGVDTNRVVVLDRRGSEQSLPVLPKAEVAEILLNCVQEFRSAASSGGSGCSNAAHR